MIEVKLEIKPVPIPLTFQPIYKIVMLLAILKYCCPKPNNATFLKLHLYFWAIRDKDNAQILLDIKNRNRNNLVPWNFEPSLERIVTLAIINNFCNRKILSNSLQIQLTETGSNLLSQVIDKGYFKDDIDLIKSIGNIGQNKILEINKSWNIF